MAATVQAGRDDVFASLLARLAGLGVVKRAPVPGRVYTSPRLEGGAGYNVGPYAYVGPELNELTIGHEKRHTEQPLLGRMLATLLKGSGEANPYEAEAYAFEHYLRDRAQPLRGMPGALNVVRRR